MSHSSGAGSGSRLPVLAIVAALILLAGGLTFWKLLEVVFPSAPPLPSLPAPMTPPASRVAVRFSFIEQLAAAQQVELPTLPAAYREAVASYGRGVPLHVPGLRGLLRKVAVAMPLGLQPGSSAEVDHEVRHALYLPTPARLTWSLRLPPEARLRGALALLPVPGGASTVRLTFQIRTHPDGQLWHAQVETRPGQAVAPDWWQEFEFRLDGLAGQLVTVELSSGLPSGPADPAHPAGDLVGHLLLADPVLLGSPPQATPGRPNVLWINIDTVQSQVTTMGGGPPHLAPNIDRLSQLGVSFARAYATSNWTRPSNLSFLTGRFPSETGLKVGMIPTLPEERRSYYLSGIVALPLQLTRHGFLTRAIVQNNLLEDVWGTGVDVGFREYVYVQEDLDHSWKITDRAIRFLERHREESWFLYLGYNAPHWPYRPTREGLAHSDLLTGDLRDYLTHLYQGAVWMSDEQLGPLLEALHRLGLTDQTLVVVNSDHGEQLDRRAAQEVVRASLWEADAPTRVVSRPGHETLFDEVTRVPLLFSWPGQLPTGRRIDEPVAMYDVPVTILDLLRLPPLPQARGRSLLPLLLGQPRAAGPNLPILPILIEGKSIRAVVDGDWKYIRRGLDSGEEWVRYRGAGLPWQRVPEELYDLAHDPDERHDLARERPEELQRLRRVMERLLPADRHLYFFEARQVAEEGGVADSPAGALPLELRIRLTPASAVGAIQLLEEEDEDRVVLEAGAWLADLHVAPGDGDQLAFTLAHHGAQVELTLLPRTESAQLHLLLGTPVRTGRWELPTEGTTFKLSDEDGFVHFDSDRDPARRASGFYCWRIPIVNGILGRGGELDASVQETFRGWGYVQ